jgi:hypothetical protein
LTKLYIRDKDVEYLETEKSFKQFKEEVGMIRLFLILAVLGGLSVSCTSPTSVENRAAGKNGGREML